VFWLLVVTFSPFSADIGMQMIFSKPRSLAKAWYSAVILSKTDWL
jgi:hypothetical protein